MKPGEQNGRKPWDQILTHATTRAGKVVLLYTDQDHTLTWVVSEDGRTWDYLVETTPESLFRDFTHAELRRLLRATWNKAEQSKLRKAIVLFYHR